MNNRKIDNRQSRGEMISSITFFGVGIWFSLEALVYFDTRETLKAILFCFLAVFNYAAAFRFQIARLYARFKEKN